MRNGMTSKEPSKNVKLRRWSTMAAGLAILSFGSLFLKNNSDELSNQDAGVTTKRQGKIKFNRDIRPIFSETCFHCHGNDEHGRAANLRLDFPEHAYAANVDGLFPIVPGDLKKSEAWKRISSTDPELQMPPPDSNLALTAEQKGAVKQWIEEGAVYEPHWAFITPEKEEPPVTKNRGWGHGPIDQFILARLEAEGLSPSPEADRRTLIRRLSFDLTGLPPTRAEIAAFLADETDGAYERVIDRLLASPHFGERLAQFWMDQARYADTNGFSIDGGRHMWIWRDWVIQAFNGDMPFDQFTREQLAGDLLPNATIQQRVATGFNRNHMITHEGGTIDLENLTTYCVDRVQTASEVFMGLTMACAQCHDHKYDPISQKDYYRFFAYFWELDDKGKDGNAGRNAGPIVSSKTAIQHRDVKQIAEKILTLETELYGDRSDQLAGWIEEERDALDLLGRDLELHPLKVLSVKSPNRDGSTSIKDEVAVRTTGSAQPNSVSLALPDDLSKPVTGLRLVFYPAGEAGKESIGHHVDTKLSQELRTKKTELQKLQKKADADEAQVASLKKEVAELNASIAAHADTGSMGVQGISVSVGTMPGDEIDLNRIHPIREATASFSRVDNAAPEAIVLSSGFWTPSPNIESEQHLTLQFEEPVDPEETPYLTTQIVWQLGAPKHYRIFALTGRDDGTNLPEDIQRTIRLTTEERSSEEQSALAKYHAENSPGLQGLRNELAVYQQRHREMTEAFSTLIMNTAKKPRKAYVLDRGVYDQPGEAVSPGTPTILPPLPEGAPANRVALADWLVREDHPLLSRVTVNRFWQLFFGTGLVATSADFGSQGEWPSHPELLDWLAVDFRENEWGVKRMLKQILMSATYKQQSTISPEIAAMDPQNRLLSHGPRFRVQAEFIRDAALKHSDLLVPWVGGSSVKPYQPAGLWREVSHYGSSPATSQVFAQDNSLSLRRRSLYTYWKRTVPPPNMVAFDAPNRELCVMKRPITNTPIQALVLLNDPQFVEASRAYAERIIKQMPHADRRERIRVVFEETTSRLPERHEMDLLTAAYEEQQAFFTEQPDAAEAFLKVGDQASDEDLDRVEFATLTQIISLILNLSETITKG